MLVNETDHTALVEDGFYFQEESAWNCHSIRSPLQQLWCTYCLFPPCVGGTPYVCDLWKGDMCDEYIRHRAVRPYVILSMTLVRASILVAMSKMCYDSSLKLDIMLAQASSG